MYDDDRNSLAAEYVLGTLTIDERDQAEALLAIDPGFAETVQLWERRLGELNVMVEAVEPPPELWDKIKAELAPARPPIRAPAESVPPEFEVGAPDLAMEPAAPIEAGAAVAFEEFAELEMPAADELAAQAPDAEDWLPSRRWRRASPRRMSHRGGRRRRPQCRLQGWTAASSAARNATPR